MYTDNLTKETPLAVYGNDAEGLERLFRETKEYLENMGVVFEYNENVLLDVHSKDIDGTRLPSAAEGCLMGSVVLVRILTGTAPNNISIYPEEDNEPLTPHILDIIKLRKSMFELSEHTPAYEFTDVEAGFANHPYNSSYNPDVYDLGHMLRSEFIVEDDYDYNDFDEDEWTFDDEDDYFEEDE